MTTLNLTFKTQRIGDSGLSDRWFSAISGHCHLLKSSVSVVNINMWTGWGRVISRIISNILDYKKPFLSKWQLKTSLFFPRLVIYLGWKKLVWAPWSPRYLWTNICCLWSFHLWNSSCCLTSLPFPGTSKKQPTLHGKIFTNQKHYQHSYADVPAVN